MAKLDLKKQYKELYKPSAKEVVVVDVPEFKFVQVDGQIEPGISVDQAPDYLSSIELLYGLSYVLKFMSKLREDNPIDYTVMALEGLWWAEGSDQGFDVSRDHTMYFTSMMMQPDHITQEMFEQALEDLRKKKDNPLVDKARFVSFREGLCMQIMHIGPYADEASTIAKIDAFAEQNGYSRRGKHHEIYLSDPRRAKPENLKTVLRHPIEKI
jgi:hypothetical protein